MTLIPWRKEFETGVESIDHEHQNLISAINDLAVLAKGERPTQQIQASLAEIHALIEAHFALEEKVMRSVGYEGYAEHKADHDRLLDDIRDIMDEVAAGADTDVPAAIADRTGRWFGNHFRTLDRRLHALTGH